MVVFYCLITVAGGNLCVRRRLHVFLGVVEVGAEVTSGDPWSHSSMDTLPGPPPLPLTYSYIQFPKFKIT